MKISTPELKVVRFENEDVIATSFYIIENAESSTGVSFFYGTMYGPIEDGATWGVGTTGELYDMNLEDLENIRNGGSNGYTYTMYGENVYDAYKDEYGYYKTKGASYYDLYGNQ